MSLKGPFRKRQLRTLVTRYITFEYCFSEESVTHVTGHKNINEYCFPEEKFSNSVIKFYFLPYTELDVMSCQAPGVKCRGVQ